MTIAELIQGNSRQKRQKTIEKKKKKKTASKCFINSNSSKKELNGIKMEHWSNIIIINEKHKQFTMVAQLILLFFSLPFLFTFAKNLIPRFGAVSDVSTSYAFGQLHLITAVL